MLVDLELEVKCLTFNEELPMFLFRLVTVLSCMKDAFCVSYCVWKVFLILQLVQYNLVQQNVGYSF